MKIKNIFLQLFGSLTALFALSSLAVDLAAPKMSLQEILIQFNGYAQQVKTDWQVPGMAIAIVKDNKIIYARGFGKRNIQGTPVNADTIFDIASLTKSFTAALLAVQIDQGKYTWDTPVIKLYPQFRLYDPQLTNKFAVRDLIAHDSGLPEETLDEMGDFGYSIDQTLHALQFIKPIAGFRQQFAYQDVFLEIAKKIIESNSGDNYADNLNKKIFMPLAMRNSYVRTDPELSRLNNVAEPFLYYEGKNYNYPKDYPYLSQSWALEPGLAGGGIKSSALDIAKWLIFNMRTNGMELISEKNMDYIHSPQIVIAGENGKIDQAYGEGWFINKSEYALNDLLYHSGGGTGMHALMAYIPQAKIGIVILTNQYGNKAPEILYKRFFDLYFNKQPLKDWNKIYLQDREEARAEKAKNNKPVSCSTNTALNLAKYTGIYFNPVYGDLKLEKQGDRLLLTIGPQRITWELTFCQNNLFKAYWPNPGHRDIPMLSTGYDQVEFTFDANTAVHQMIIPLLDDNGIGVFLKKKT